MLRALVEEWQAAKHPMLSGKVDSRGGKSGLPSGKEEGLSGP